LAIDDDLHRNNLFLVAQQPLACARISCQWRIAPGDFLQSIASLFDGQPGLAGNFIFAQGRRIISRIEWSS
jgi:hypothetical protein